MGYNAQTVEGGTVHIVNKETDGGEAELFTDIDGRQYRLDSKNGRNLLKLIEKEPEAEVEPEVVPEDGEGDGEAVPTPEEVEATATVEAVMSASVAEGATAATALEAYESITGSDELPEVAPTGLTNDDDAA